MPEAPKDRCSREPPKFLLYISLRPPSPGVYASGSSRFALFAPQPAIETSSRLLPSALLDIDFPLLPSHCRPPPPDL